MERHETRNFIVSHVRYRRHDGGYTWKCKRKKHRNGKKRSKHEKASYIVQESIVSSVSSQACDRTRNSLHSAYKISETKARWVFVCRKTTSWNSTTFRPVYRDVVLRRCSKISAPGLYIQLEFLCIKHSFYFKDKEGTIDFMAYKLLRILWKVLIISNNIKK